MAAFPTRNLLSITTGRLLTARVHDDDNGVGGMYEALDWLNGGESITMDREEARQVARSKLLAHHPVLASVDGDLPRLDEMLSSTSASHEVVERWLSETLSKHKLDTMLELPASAGPVAETPPRLALAVKK